MKIQRSLCKPKQKCHSTSTYNCQNRADNNQQILKDKSELQRYHIYQLLINQYKKYSIQHFKKNKHFFKPQQFIWNNSHRTSKKHYPFFHKAKQQYQLKKAPLIKQQHQNDSKQKVFNLNLFLSQKRNQTRFKFYSKQLQRVSLQKKIRFRRLSTITVDAQINVLQNKRSNFLNTMNQFSETFCAHSIKKHPNVMNLLKKSNSNLTKIQYSKIVKSKQSFPINQQTYLQSLNYFDSKLQNKKQLAKQGRKAITNRFKVNLQKQKYKQKQNRIKKDDNIIKSHKQVNFNPQ